MMKFRITPAAPGARSFTCPVPAAGDPLAVVDGRLGGHGLEGLRVADASVMPTSVSAHICAADLIREDAGQR